MSSSRLWREARMRVDMAIRQKDKQGVEVEWVTIKEFGEGKSLKDVLYKSEIHAIRFRDGTEWDQINMFRDRPWWKLEEKKERVMTWEEFDEEMEIRRETADRMNDSELHAVCGLVIARLKPIREIINPPDFIYGVPAHKEVIVSWDVRNGVTINMVFNRNGVNIERTDHVYKLKV